MKIIQIGAKVGEGEGIGYGNAGDTAIGSAFNYLFEKEFQGSEVIFINSRKIFTENDIAIINSADLLVVSGGGLFLYDTFKNNISDWQWGISTDLIEKITLPIIVYSVGYNKFRNQRPFRNSFNETVNKLASKSLFFSLRNSGSCNSIKQHLEKQNHSKVKLNFCPTMLLNEKFQIPTNNKSKSVGFILAGDRLTNRHQNLDKFVKNISKFVDYLKKNKWETILVNHQNDFWIKDYIKFDKTIDLFGKESELIYQVYSKMDTVIADRGHGQMIPFSCGCKILTPISHNKLSWFLQDMGLEEFGIDENDDNLSDKLIEKFEKLQTIDWIKIQKEKMEIVKEINSKNLLYIKNELLKILSK